MNDTCSPRVKLFSPSSSSTFHDRLSGLVVRRPHRERKIRGSIPVCAVGISPGSSHTSDLRIGTPVAALSGAWHYTASAGTGWPGVILCLGEVDSWICNF